MAVTLEDIGKRTGCSPATISRILNNSAPVSQEIREAVLKEIRRTGYQPRQRRRRQDAAAMEKRLDTVDVVMFWHSPEYRLGDGREDELRLRPEDLGEQQVRKDPFKVGYGFFRHIIDGIVEELAANGHKAALQVCSDLMNPRFLDDINRPDSQGVVLLGEYSPDVARFVDRCARPLVLVDIMHDSWPDVVTIDNVGGIRQAYAHLRELGHRDLGFIGRDVNPAYREREEAFRSLLVADGLPTREEWFFEDAEDVEKTADGVEPIIRRSHRPTAFMCACDYAAMGVIRAAGRVGISVPGELSVMGFDDSDPAQLVTPALSTIRVPTRQLGRQAVRQLSISQAGASPTRREKGCEIRVRTELVVRQSTGPAHPVSAN